MKRKLTFKQKIALYKMRNLSWKDRKEIDRPLTHEEEEELAKLEEEFFEENYEK